MKKIVYLCFLSLSLIACQKDTPSSDTTEDYLHIKHLGGQATSNDLLGSSHAFSFPIPLNTEESELHLLGDANFERNFSDDPSRPEYGLGPVFNNTSCLGCHNRDGRGSLPVGLNTSSWVRLNQNDSLFLRISIEDDQLNEGPPTAVPGYSSQLFHLGSYGVRKDFPGVGQAEVWIRYEESQFQYPDGEQITLVKPLFKIENPYDAYIDSSERIQSRLWQTDVKTSPRMSLPLFGLGLLEAVPESDILNLAKVKHPEGVSGRPNYVLDINKVNTRDPFPYSLGRFGWKANSPSIEQQSLGALNGDLGVTNYLFPEESIVNTKLYNDYVRGEESFISHKNEASDELAHSLVFYSSTLAVPPRRNINDPQVVQGGRLFKSIRCTSCHVPQLTTGASSVSSLSYQRIFPFTDMLLHDMGEGLADHRQDFKANGREWKTRPLWGVGLTQVVNPRASFLHDGRARTLEEAIVWHGGEAQYSRDQFIHLSKNQRQQVLAFLKSL
ncbi:MAG: thiol oxidoreductase [Bdellovibrionales bacterium]|nr:thiol oxidoreductase [Bdellovibrionales bacterium]